MDVTCLCLYHVTRLAHTNRFFKLCLFYQDFRVLKGFPHRWLCLTTLRLTPDPQGGSYRESHPHPQSMEQGDIQAVRLTPSQGLGSGGAGEHTGLGEHSREENALSSVSSTR